jgi:uncharacterized protein (TIGR03382 family)
VHRTTAVAIAIALMTTSTVASAYCQKSTCREDRGDVCQHDENDCISSGVGVEWPASTYPVLPYHFNAHGSKQFAHDDRMRTVIRRAFHTWTEVSCDDGPTSLSFQEGPDVDDALVRGKPAPRHYAIYFRDDGWTEDPSSLAVTRVDTIDTSGTVTGASIEVNTFERRFRLGTSDQGDYDLQAVVTHEVGHYIGLDHSSAPGSIMAPTYCGDERPCKKDVEELRALGDDDRAAVCRLFPPGATKPEPSSCNASGSTGAWPWALFVPAAMALRRRRRHRQSSALRAVGRSSSEPQ